MKSNTARTCVESFYVGLVIVLALICLAGVEMKVTKRLVESRACSCCYLSSF